MIADLFIAWLSTPVPARVSSVVDLFLSVTVAPAGMDARNMPVNSALSVSFNPSEYIPKKERGCSAPLMATAYATLIRPPVGRTVTT